MCTASRKKIAAILISDVHFTTSTQPFNVARPPSLKFTVAVCMNKRTTTSVTLVLSDSIAMTIATFFTTCQGSPHTISKIANVTVKFKHPQTTCKLQRGMANAWVTWLVLQYSWGIINLDFGIVIVACCITEPNVTNFERIFASRHWKKCDCWDGGSVKLTNFSHGFSHVLMMFNLFAVKLLKRGDNFKCHTI